MTTIQACFEDIYLPAKALLIYRHLVKDGTGVYVESYDMDDNGRPINAHPLSVEEASDLAEALDSSPEMQRSFLKPKGLLPANVLYVNPDKRGYAIWYTPPHKATLFFSKSLDIPCGKARVPALLWKADKKCLQLFALKVDKKPTLKTPLFHAPFFNVYLKGNVCMGTVDIEISRNVMLETFISQWQCFFFNSYFSHLLDGFCPVSCNIIQLWQQQIGSNRKFPVNQLKKTNYTLKNIL